MLSVTCEPYRLSVVVLNVIMLIVVAPAATIVLKHFIVNPSPIFIQWLNVGTMTLSRMTLNILAKFKNTIINSSPTFIQLFKVGAMTLNILAKRGSFSH
jgi:hypothetical protein